MLLPRLDHFSVCEEDQKIIFSSLSPRLDNLLMVAHPENITVRVKNINSEVNRKTRKQARVYELTWVLSTQSFFSHFVLKCTNFLYITSSITGAQIDLWL